MPKEKTSYSDAELDEMAHGNPPLPARPWRITGPITYIGAPRGDEESTITVDRKEVKVLGVVESRWKVEADHPVLDWHFPGRPIFPGVFGLDQLLQLTGFYAGVMGATGEGSAVKIGQVSFRAPMTPEVDEVVYKVYITQFRQGSKTVAKAQGKIWVDGILATEAFDIAAIIVASKDE